MTLHEVKPRSDRAIRIRKRLISNMRNMIKNQGDDLCGYAIVLWDHRGDCSTVYHTPDGPISSNMLPAYLSHAMNRHIVLDQIDQSATKPGA
jgi:hypothetical protein